MVAASCQGPELLIPIESSGIEAVVYQHKPDVVNQLRKLRRQGQYVPPDNLSIDNDESLA